MIRVHLECQYCGHKWFQAFLTPKALDEAICVAPGCGDSSLTVRQDMQKTDVFGYFSQEPKQDAYIRKK
jgi:hypothetical protein